MTNLNAVKGNLKRLRLARSLSQEDLAQRLNVVRQTISSWETGKTEPDLDTLIAIAAALEVDVAQLLYGSKPPDAFIANRPARIRRTVLLLIFSIAVVFLALFWQNIFLFMRIPDTAVSDFNVRSPRHLLYLFCASTLPACAYLLSSITFFSFLGIWWPIATSSCSLRRIMLLIGSGSFLLYLCLIFFVLCYAAVPLPVYYFYVWLYKRKFLFLFCGIFIELGTQPRDSRKTFLGGDKL